MKGRPAADTRGDANREDVVAVVDLGTNTALLLVAGVRQGGLEVLADERRFVRLGQQVDAGGKVTAEALARLVDALSDFRKQAASHGAGHLKVFATSASRDAENADQVAEVVREQAGWPLAIISGASEGRLSFSGALDGLQVEAGADRISLVDVGGGSTEWVMALRSPAGMLRVLRTRSADVGSVRLTERWFARQPPDPASISAAEAWATTTLHEAFGPLDLESPGGRSAVRHAVVGAAGTAVALWLLHTGADRIPHEGGSMTRNDVRGLRDRLLAATREQVEGMHPWATKGRADVLPAGALILHAALSYLGVDELRVSGRGLRHGLARAELGLEAVP